MLSIVLITAYIHSIIAFNILNTNSNSNHVLTLRQTKFDITNVSTFLGFDALDFDGKEFNPFIYDLDNIFARFMIKFNRSYTRKQYIERKINLIGTIDSIAEFIFETSTVGIRPTFTVNLNGLSDSNAEEYTYLQGLRDRSFIEKNRSNRRKRSTADNEACKPTNNDTLPRSFDSRTKNIVTSVKNQGPCGSCWAFTAIGAVESQLAMKTGRLLDLSEQVLVNCVNRGCNGGSPDLAFKHIISKGMTNENRVPYKEKVDQCANFKPVPDVRVSDYCSKIGDKRRILKNPSGTTQEYKVMRGYNIQRDIFERGAVFAMLNADDKQFQNFKRGVYNNPKCDKNITHAVLLVGWGTTKDGVDYWIAKNSWSPNWGDDGYFRIVRGKNMCGINNLYYYPILANEN